MAMCDVQCCGRLKCLATGLGVLVILLKLVEVFVIMVA